MNPHVASIVGAADRLLASRAFQGLRGGAGGLADLLLPRVCVACERALTATERGIVCGFCWTRLDAIPYPQCTRCGHPHIRHSCKWCDLLPPFVRAVRSVCWVPSGAGGQIVHALKAFDDPSLVGETLSLLAEDGDVAPGSQAADDAKGKSTGILASLFSKA